MEIEHNIPLFSDPEAQKLADDIALRFPDEMPTVRSFARSFEQHPAKGLPHNPSLYLQRVIDICELTQK